MSNPEREAIDLATQHLAAIIDCGGEDFALVMIPTVIFTDTPVVCLCLRAERDLEVGGVEVPKGSYKPLAVMVNDGLFPYLRVPEGEHLVADVVRSDSAGPATFETFDLSGAGEDLEHTLREILEQGE